MVTKYGYRRKVDKVVNVLACIGTAISMGVLFFMWVVLMACM